MLKFILDRSNQYSAGFCYALYKTIDVNAQDVIDFLKHELLELAAYKPISPEFAYWLKNKQKKKAK